MTKKKSPTKEHETIYEVRQYRRGGWVIADVSTGQELIRFDEKSSADKACTLLNKS